MEEESMPETNGAPEMLSWLGHAMPALVDHLDRALRTGDGRAAIETAGAIVAGAEMIEGVADRVQRAMARGAST
jgi:uncharacterized protein (UPF0548 family)